MRSSIVRRLEALEGDRHVQEPIGILCDRPIDEDEAAAALADWRAMVARGEASILGSVLCILGPRLTRDEWVRLHGMEH